MKAKAKKKVPYKFEQGQIVKHFTNGIIKMVVLQRFREDFCEDGVYADTLKNRYLVRWVMDTVYSSRSDSFYEFELEAVI